MKLYVANLPFTSTEEDLALAFAQYGELDSVTIITDRETGRSRGIGFVEMPCQEEALLAIQELNQCELGGRRIAVRVAKEKPREESSWPS